MSMMMSNRGVNTHTDLIAPPAEFTVGKATVRTQPLPDAPYWIYRAYLVGVVEPILEWISRPGPADILYASATHRRG